MRYDFYFCCLIVYLCVVCLFVCLFVYLFLNSFSYRNCTVYINLYEMKSANAIDK